MKADKVYAKDEHGYYWTSEYNPNAGGPYEFHTNGGCRETRSGDSYKTYGYNVRAVGTN